MIVNWRYKDHAERQPVLSQSSPSLFSPRLPTNTQNVTVCRAMSQQKGSKPRLTKMHPRKIAARSAAFMRASQAAGEHTLDSGMTYHYFYFYCY